MKVVIVGGVAGGATAAARIRRLDEEAQILVFERSGYISYANCGLPYYIGDVITDSEELTLQTPESFFSRFRVDMKVYHEVIALHPERKTVSVRNLKNGEEFEESYDKLILSPGAKPTQPRLPGIGLSRLFTPVYSENCGGYFSNQRIHQRKSSQFGCTGRRRLYRPGIGREFAGAGNGCDHCAAAEAADESF